MERALILHREGPLRLLELLQKCSEPGAASCQGESDGKFLSLEEINRIYIKQALLTSKGKISGSGGAAECIDIYPNTLRRRMDNLGIDYKKKRFRSVE